MLELGVERDSTRRSFLLESVFSPAQSSGYMRSMWFRWSFTLVIIVVMISGGVIGMGVPGGAQVSDEGSSGSAMTMRVSIQSDGSAHWSVRLRLQLSQNETEAFDSFGREYENGETDVLPMTVFESAAEQAGAVTGRSMGIEGISREAFRENRTGYFVVEFVWTNFSRVEGDQLFLGDVFQTAEGTWLPELTAEQRLIIEFPDDYAVRSSSRPLQADAFYVEGPVSFEPGQPSANLERINTGSPPDTVTPGEESIVPPIAGIGVFIVLALSVSYLYVRRNNPLGRADRGDPSDEEEAVAGTESDADEGAPTPEPLLSDEEQVLQLLRENDGRMKQVAIVNETNWSNAKVSQLLSEMDAAGKIEKLRIGRENLISLPEDSLE